MEKSVNSHTLYTFMFMLSSSYIITLKNDKKALSEAISYFGPQKYEMVAKMKRFELKQETLHH